MGLAEQTETICHAHVGHPQGEHCPVGIPRGSGRRRRMQMVTSGTSETEKCRRREKWSQTGCVPLSEQAGLESWRPGYSKPVELVDF